MGRVPSVELTQASNQNLKRSLRGSGPERTRDGLARVFKPRKVPPVGEVPALLRLDRLDEALVPFEKDAVSVGFLDEAQAQPIGSQAGEFLDEVKFAAVQELGQRRHFGLREFDLARPAAAGRAALAIVQDFHTEPSVTVILRFRLVFPP